MTAPTQQTVEQFLETFKQDLADLIAAKLRDSAPAQNRLLTIPQVAERLGVTERTARGLTYKLDGNPPQLASLKVGAGNGATRVEESVLEAFIAERRVAGRQEA